MGKWLKRILQKKEIFPLANYQVDALSERKSVEIKLEDNKENDHSVRGLPTPIYTEILFNLPPEQALNFAATCRWAYVQSKEYYQLAIQEYFGDAIPVEVIAKLIGNSQLRFDSNRALYVFLINNLLKASISVTGRFISGCFKGQSFLEVTSQLNCWKLFSVEKFRRLSNKSQKELLFSLAEMKSEAGFRYIIQNLFKSLDTFNVLSFFNESLKFKLSLKKLRIVVEEATETGILHNLGLTLVETAIVTNKETEFETFIGQLKNLQDNSSKEAKESSNNIVGNPSCSPNDLLLAIYLQDLKKLTQLLSVFNEITDTHIVAILVASYKTNNAGIVKIIFEKVSPQVIALGLKKALSEILNDENYFENTFSIFIEKFQDYVPAEEWQNILSSPASFAAIMRVHSMVKKASEHFKKSLNISSLALKILTEETEDFWNKQPRSKKMELNQKFLNRISLMYLAVLVGNKAAVQWLLENKVNFETAEVLWAAITNDDLAVSIRCEIIEVLLKEKRVVSQIANSETTLTKDPNRAVLGEKRTTRAMILCATASVSDILILKTVYESGKQELFLEKQENILPALMMAVKLNDLAKVDYLLGMAPNLKFNLASILSISFDPPLDILVFKRLLAHPFVSLQSNTAESSKDALYYAIKMQRYDFVLALLKKGICANASDPLSIAISQGSFKIAKLLLAGGADPFPSHSRHFSPFQELLRLGEDLEGNPNRALNYEFLSLMLEKVKNFPDKAVYFNSYKKLTKPQDCYATVGVTMVGQLLRHNVPINILENFLNTSAINLNCPRLDNNKKEMSTLVWEIVSEELKRDRCLVILNTLIQYGANLFYGNSNDISCTRKLLENGIELQSQWLDVATADQLQQTLCELLKDRKTNSSRHKIIDENIATILWHANFSPQNLKLDINHYMDLLFLNFGKNLENLFKDVNIEVAKRVLFFTEYDLKRNLLHYAAGLKNSFFLEKLIDLKIYAVNTPDGEGQTALHYAIQSGHEQTIKVLLMQPDAKLEITPANTKMLSAWHLGKNNGHFVMTAMENQHLRSQLDHLDPKASVRLFWKAHHGGLANNKDILEFFHQVHTQFDPGDIMKFAADHYARFSNDGGFFSNSTSEQILRIELLEIIKAYADSDQGQFFVPNRVTIQFISRCKERKEYGEVSDRTKNYDQLVNELEERFASVKISSSIFFNTATSVKNSDHKESVSQERFTKISFLGIQR